MAQHTRTVLSALSILAFILQPSLRASNASQTGITLIPGTVTLEASQEAALVDVLDRAAPSLPSNMHYATVSALDQSGGWFFASLVGLEQLNQDRSWLLDEATWLGLVLMARSAVGAWQAAVQGTPEYEALLVVVPDSALSASAKMSLSPTRRLLAPTETYRFPWAAGTSMQYGVLGVHDGGFSRLGDYKGWTSCPTATPPPATRRTSCSRPPRGRSTTSATTA